MAHLKYIIQYIINIESSPTVLCLFTAVQMRIQMRLYSVMSLLTGCSTSLSVFSLQFICWKYWIICSENFSTLWILLNVSPWCHLTCSYAPIFPVNWLLDIEAWSINAWYFFTRILHRQYCVIVTAVMSACLFCLLLWYITIQQGSLPGSTISLGVAKLWHSNSVIPSSFISWNTSLKKTCHQLFLYVGVYPNRKGRINSRFFSFAYYFSK